MQRRTFLSAGAVSIVGLSGCLSGGSGSGSYPTPNDGNTDGYPPKSAVSGAKDPQVDVSSLATTKQNGQDVPLLPLADAIEWYERREARFADARGPKQYETSHITGAVLSPAPGIDTNFDEDPVKNWSKDDRIVCYCGCPHHLSSLRAAALMNSGYEKVFVIDEGFWAWHDAGYPINGRNTKKAPANYAIDGVTSDEFAGESAWARHPDSGQNEATDIQQDGSYTMHLKFHDVTPSSAIVVETPEYTVEGSLEALSNGVVQG